MIGPFGRLLTRSARLIAATASMYMALEVALGELRADRFAAIGAVGSHTAGGVVGALHHRRREGRLIELLAIMHRGAAYRVTRHQVVPPVNADEILVTKMRRAMLLDAS